MSYIISHDRAVCIGCGACVALAPDFWSMLADGKAQLVHSKVVGNMEELELQDLKNNKDAAESCPVNAIHIVIKENNKKII